MKRRNAVRCILLLVVAPALGAQPVGKVHRVGFVASTSPLADVSGENPANPFARAFVHGLRDLGYIQGKNLVLDIRTLDDKPERLDAVMAEFVRLRTDVVFLPSVALVLRAHKVVPKMPIVGLLVGSVAVDAGLARSMARPGGMVTGLTIDLEEEVTAKRLELLLQLVPRARRLAYIGHAEEWERPYVSKMRAVAEQLGVTVVHVQVTGGAFGSAFSRLRQVKADAFMVETSARAYGRRREIGQLAHASGLPGSCGASELVEHGCLMSYSPDNLDWGRRCAGYVDKILKGATPAELPIEAPSKFDFVINASTAKALGIAIPLPVLLRADRVID
jgi:putative ABC transport system substrate-binding protein